MNKIEYKLKKPFPLQKIRWRPGNTNAKKLGVKPWEATEGAALAYIDARDVEQRLDDVVGMSNWQCRYSHAQDGMVICEIGIRWHVIDESVPIDQWIWKSNGAGETDIEGKKGACSQALVRAASVWGIGRYLYGLPFSWVKLSKGKIIDPPSVPEWATPDGFDRIMLERGEIKEDWIK